MLDMLIFFAVGLLLGLFYMTALFMTVRIMDRMSNPKRFLALTALLRFVVVLGVFYFILQSAEWYAVFLTLLGFILVRTLWVWGVKAKGNKKKV